MRFNGFLNIITNRGGLILPKLIIILKFNYVYLFMFNVTIPISFKFYYSIYSFGIDTYFHRNIYSNFTALYSDWYS